MSFFWKKRASTRNPSSASFEAAFKKRLGQDPISYITNKLSNGSDIRSVRHLFDIISAEIAHQNKCISPCFDFYLEKISVNLPSKPQPKITKGFAASQLIGKERFIVQYKDLLKRLSTDKTFMKFVMTLRQELSGQEVTDTKTANKRIADYFYTNKANEQFPEVRKIVEAVLSYGKQSSAHISIYYAMFIYEE